MTTRLTPMLWFDDEAEEAADFYVAIFPNSRITEVTRHDDAGPGATGRAMVVAFELDGQPFTALNGGPHFKFTEAISLVVNCEDQPEVDCYWDRLLADGGVPQQCGWLKDRFGLSWQVVPIALIDMLKDPDPARSSRATAAMMKMIRLDVGEAHRAFDPA